MKRNLINFCCISFILLLCIVLLSVVIFREHQIVSDVEECKIVEILYTPSLEKNTVSLLDYDESVIVDCLEKYHMKPTLRKSNSFQTGEYKLIITLHDGKTIKQVRLGLDRSFVSEGAGAPQYIIRYGNQLLESLLEILKVS